MIVFGIERYFIEKNWSENHQFRPWIFTCRL